MLRKKIWIPILCVFVIAMGCGLFYGRKVANQEPVKVYKPVEVSKQPVAPKPPPPGETYETGHWHGDEWHSEPHKTPLPLLPADIFAIDTEKHSRTFVSFNPLIPNPIPEHVQMPPKWQDWYYMEAYAEPAELAKYEQRLEEITRYIIQDYNPGRPLQDMWVEFIETERQLMADSPYDEENFGIPSLGGYRADWLYQQIWNFPEVFEMILSEEKENAMWVNVFHIDMGYLEPDWNVFYLHDGREFRTRDGYRYEFVSGYNEDKGYYRNTYSFAYGDIQNAETITVNLDTISET
ncbi:hypothetical protein F4Z98_13575, partial [Candidatus Poribacteria bacterium]|nr:hypothetical protein [Candidatus Poribacteria bacterium]